VPSRFVCRHSAQLYAPADFKDEDNDVRTQLATVASLTAASLKTRAVSETDIQGLVAVVRQAPVAGPAQGGAGGNHVLWVDDQPDNHVYERQAFEAVGLRFTLARSTAEALASLKQHRYAAFISGMGRAAGPRAVGAG
jgi:hypothetical protein